MATNGIFTVEVKRTEERLKVYQLQNGNYYDWENMAENLPPSAKTSAKKEFKKKELIFIN